ncbi:hypothetical protein O181_081503 [Austropuccinia psidii MF-1]|uniref:Uncharacterized protein n=1 Tax=Austropuccinia psidii MF-1 TaxID=1389203 RepID=A0A9Q3FKQ8_9BASI|nr:hypothetical protein [Austropuccinia psidii MF-1]
MIPHHFRDFGVPKDYSLQRESTIIRNRGLERREVEVVQSHKTWQNEPSYTFQDGFQQQTSRNGLHRTVYSNPSDLPRTSPMENGRQGIQTRVPLQRACRKYSEDFPQRDILQKTYHREEMKPEIIYSDPLRLMRTGIPARLPSGFKSLRHQQISDQESPYFQSQMESRRGRGSRARTRLLSTRGRKSHILLSRNCWTCCKKYKERTNSCKYF